MAASLDATREYMKSIGTWKFDFFDVSSVPVTTRFVDPIARPFTTTTTTTTTTTNDDYYYYLSFLQVRSLLLRFSVDIVWLWT
jgi:hypothetical protein